MNIFRRRMGIGLGLVLVSCVAGLALLAYVTLRPVSKGECNRKMISTSMSSDRVWQALVGEEICSDGYFVTTDTEVVRLVRNNATQRTESDVFSADHSTGGVGRRNETWPVIRWLGPRLLEIEVPNKSLIGLSKERFEDVAIRIKFNPDNPEERKRWLKDIERGPGSKP